MLCAALFAVACTEKPAEKIKVEETTKQENKVNDTQEQTIVDNSAGINKEKSQAIVLLRGLPTLDTKHSVAIVELDPESDSFGEIIQDFEFDGMDLPLHHLYYSPTGRLYATGLDGKCSLAEIKLVRDVSGAPLIKGSSCIDTHGQQVGEDIMWHTSNGKEYMFVTFMAGGGLDQADGGSVGVSMVCLRTTPAHCSMVLC